MVTGGSRVISARELLPTAPLYLVSESGALAQLAAIKLEREGIRLGSPRKFCT